MNTLNLVLSIALFLLIVFNLSWTSFLYMARKGMKMEKEQVEDLRRVMLSVTSMGMVFSNLKKGEEQDAVDEYRKWRNN